MKEIENIHIICCNDSTEFAVIGDEAIAEKKLEELRIKYFNRNKHAFGTYKEYLIRCYWHIHTVDGLLDESQERSL